MSIDLDPREVLKYLNQLGYSNITKEQLKDFIHDLKKLVKYDAMKCKCELDACSHIRNPPRGTEPNYGKPRPQCQENPCNLKNRHTHGGSEISSSCTGPNYSNIANVQGLRVRNENLGTTPSRTSQKNRKQDILYCSLASSTNTSQSTTETSPNTSSSINSSTDSFNDNLKCEEKSIKSVNSNQKSSGAENMKVPKKTTSFIRPWRLSSGTLQTRVAPRNDPVSLYHHYQMIWKRQKVPGEDNHSDLRWAIRERMLGQDPHPRPVSQASSVEHLKRPYKKK